MKHSALGLVAVLALIVAACGGVADAGSEVASLDDAATGDTVVDDADNAEVDVEQALLDFTACLRDHGIDAEDPTVDADGNVQFGRFGGQAAPGEDFDREAARAAREACQEHLDGVTLGFRDRDQTELQDQLFEYAACMRDNGYEMSDPDFSGFGPGSDAEPAEFRGPFGEVDFDDPAFQAAQEACQDILAGFGPGGGPGLRGGGPGGGSGD